MDHFLLTIAFKNIFPNHGTHFSNSTPCILKITKPTKTLLVKKLEVGKLESLERKVYNPSTYCFPYHRRPHGVIFQQFQQHWLRGTYMLLNQRPVLEEYGEIVPYQYKVLESWI